MKDKPLSRRGALRGFASAAGAFASARLAAAQSSELAIGAVPVELAITGVSARTVRITLMPLRDGQPQEIPQNGALVRRDFGTPRAKIRSLSAAQNVELEHLAVKIAPPLTLEIGPRDGQPVQRLSIDPLTGAVEFAIGKGPLFGLGEGGPQFDRRGSVDTMRSGQGGYRLRTHGGRVPIPWLVGAQDGWALFFHQPFGIFDLNGEEGRFEPASAATALPLDLFVVASREPAAIMEEYARMTGYPEMPPLWSFGYQQSHRTLAGPDEILAEAKTFREKRLPCDTMIYLGTGFCPSGWNTENGSFAFNPSVFPDPPKMIDKLHADHFKVAVHVVILSRKLRGTVHDPCALDRFDEQEASCYWDMHRKVFATGVDGWWPDEGDPLDITSRLTRNRMYWEGPQIDRPDERPFALHRNGYAGMQRYASFLWSGDVYSTWETLRTHIPIAVNTGLSGVPYWGTDIGGFVPTREFTAELYLRWFQFAAFCPLFRAHGRTWKLRLPWGWNTGDLGPKEITNYGEAADPDPSELHNARVEPICRKYLELRYRLMPYLYSAVRECCRTGMPIVRALWLHYAGDAAAAARGDEYLWGRDILVAPVTEKEATSRRLYLPPGRWYDFWTNKGVEGGREITRPVDLATMPLYVRAGAVLPMGPVKQYTAEEVDEPLSLTVYPGADSSSTLYEDDGRSFKYRSGEWMGVVMDWNQASRTLSLRLAEGSKILPPLTRKIRVRSAGEERAHEIAFNGENINIQLR